MLDKTTPIKALLICVCFLFNLKATAQQLDWFTEGDVGSKNGVSNAWGTATDTSENSYVIGSIGTTNQPAQFGSYSNTVTNAGIGYLSSYNDTGGIRWINWVGASNCIVYMQDIVYKNGYIYAMAMYAGDSAKLDTITLPAIDKSKASSFSNPITGIVIAKYTESGKLVKHFTGKANVRINSAGLRKFKLNIDHAEDGVLLSNAGAFLKLLSDSAFYSPGSNINPFYLSKISFSGDSIVWNKKLETKFGYSYLTDPVIQIDDSNNIHIMGNFNREIIYDQDTLNAKKMNTDASYLLQINSDGSVKQLKHLWEGFHPSKFLYEGMNQYLIGAALEKSKIIKIGSKTFITDAIGDLILTAYDANGDSIGNNLILESWAKEPRFNLLKRRKNGKLYIGFGALRELYWKTDTLVLHSYTDYVSYYALLDSSFNRIWGTASDVNALATTYLFRSADVDSEGSLMLHFQKSTPAIIAGKTLQTSKIASKYPLITARIGDCSDADTAILSSYKDQYLCNNSSVTLKTSNKKGRYQWTYSGLPISNANDSSYKAILPGNYNLILDDAGCKDTSLMVKVLAQPSGIVKFPDLPELCTRDTSLILNSATPKGGTYKGYGVVQDSIFKKSITGKGTFPITYVYTDSIGCSDSVTKSIKVSGTSVFFSSLNRICASASAFSLTNGFPTGGSYFGNGVVGSLFSPKTAGAGSHTLGYHVQSGSCSDTAYQTIQIDSIPIVTLDSISPKCETQFAIALTQGKPSGGNYLSSYTIGNNFYPSISGDGIFQLGYTYTDLNGCKDTAFRSIQIDPSDTARLSPFTTLCSNSPDQVLSGGTPWGGKYRINGTIDLLLRPSSLGSGNHTIKYQISNTCVVDSATQTLSINASPTVSLPSFSPYCISADSFGLTTGTPAGGTYRIGGNTVVGFSPTQYGKGTFPVTYTYIDGNSCQDSTTKRITVNPLPTVSFTSLPDQCNSNSIFVLTQGSPVGGTYTGNGVNGTNFNASSAGVGTHTLKYTFTDSNSCTDSADQTISVLSAPVLSHPLVNDVCSGSSAFQLTGALPVGGTYVGAGTDSTGLFSPGLANIGTNKIYYVYGSACGIDSIEVNIQVYAQPNVTLAGFLNVCANADSVTLSGASPVGGTFSGTSVYGSKFNPAIGVGSYSITYSFTDTNSCTDSASQTLVVDSVPVVSLSSIPNVCANASSVTLSQGTPAGGTYSGAGVSGSNFTPSVVGTSTIKYKFTDLKGCSDSASASIQVDSVPKVSFTAPSDRCQAAPTVVLNTGKPVGGSYSGTGVYLNSFYPDSAQAGKHVISYSFTDGNNCTDSIADTVEVYAQPTVTLASFSNVCANADSVTLSGAGPIGGNFSGTSVYGTKFNPAIGVGSYSITYSFTNANSCTDSASQTLVVDSVPVVTLSSIPNICANAASVSLSQGTPTGGTYSGTGISGSNFTPIAVGSSTIKYKFTDLKGCSDSTSGNIQVDSVPNILFILDSAICKNANALTLSGTPIGGTYSGKAVTGNLFDPAISASNRDSVTYSYIDLNGCSDSVIRKIKIDSVPKVSFASLVGICKNEDQRIITGGLPSGGKYYSPFIDTANHKFSTSLSGSGKFEVIYVYSDANSCTDSAKSILAVWENPSVNLGNDTTICNVQVLELNPNIDSASHDWSTGKNTKGITVGTAGTYWVLVTDSNGCSSSDTIAVSYEAICTGISEINGSDYSFKYYPNPTNGKLHVDITNYPQNKASLTVRNAAGRIMKKIKLEGIDEYYDFTLNLSEFPDGMYFIEFSSKDISSMHRIILNK